MTTMYNLHIDLSYALLLTLWIIKKNVNTKLLAFMLDFSIFFDQLAELAMSPKSRHSLQLKENSNILQFSGIDKEIVSTKWSNLYILQVIVG